MKYKAFPLQFILTVAASLLAQYCVGQTKVVFYGTNMSSIGVSFV